MLPSGKKSSLYLLLPLSATRPRYPGPFILGTGLCIVGRCSVWRRQREAYAVAGKQNLRNFSKNRFPYATMLYAVGIVASKKQIYSHLPPGWMHCMGRSREPYGQRPVCAMRGQEVPLAPLFALLLHHLVGILGTETSSPSHTVVVGRCFVRRREGEAYVVDGK